MCGFHGSLALQLTRPQRKMEHSPNPFPALGLNVAALALSFSSVEQGLRIAGLVISLLVGVVTLYRMLNK
jgi:hypothetical protein